jgi:GGDEF domain-containing protein
LAVIERKMEQASTLDDIRLLRLRLQDCLTIVREESVRLRSESDARMVASQEKIESISSPEAGLGPGVIAVDPVTCLENYAAAEKLIFERISEGKACAMALFVAGKLVMVNRRFGRTMGDEVLFMVAQHISKSLPPNSILFRWRGPALAAVVEIQPSFEEVSRKLARIAGAQLEKSIDEGGRIALVPISLLLFTQRIGVNSDTHEVFKAMDQFVVANTMEEQPVASGY